MTKPTVTVEEVVLEGSTPKSQIRCTFEGNGIGPFSIYLPKNASPSDIAQALEHKAFFWKTVIFP